MLVSRLISIALVCLVVGAACGNDGDASGLTISQEPSAQPTSIETTPVDGQPAAPEPTSDEQAQHGNVDVDGVSFAYKCDGDDEPLVVLEHGLATPAIADIDLWMNTRTAISEFATACSYGRRGVMGTEPLDPGTVRATRDQVDELRALVDAAGWQGPFVLVAHSGGGLNAMLFAATYPDLVSGVVLVDSAHPDMASVIGVGGGLTGPPEFLDADASFAQLSPLPDLGDIPVQVLARGANVLTVKGSPERGLEPMSSVPVFMGSEDQWAGLQEGLLALSTNATLTSLSDSGHIVEVDRPDAIAEATRRIVELAD